jgi:ribosome-binding protein aMBF1 (putative translation factor)
MLTQINNIPVNCHICGSTAYGKENVTNLATKIIIECIWVCQRCGGIAKRHTEEIRKDEQKRA